MNVLMHIVGLIAIIYLMIEAFNTKDAPLIGFMLLALAIWGTLSLILSSVNEWGDRRNNEE